MTLEEILKHNQGVRIGKRPADFIGGTIPYEVRVENGDWRSFQPTGEKQYRPPVDFMACVTFSALNSCEFQNIQQGNPEVNFSDRFTAKDSGTTHQGNWLYKVADSIRAGIVLESDYSTPDNVTWDTYYQTIPQEVYAKRKVYDVAYEWINKRDIAYHLKHAPIQIIITNSYPNHAVLAVYQVGDTVYYFDSYEPFIKTININDVYPDALKIVGNFKNMFKVKKVKINGAWGVLVDMPNGSAITKAEDEVEWRSYSKPDSYQIKSINSDGSTNWDVDLEINFS